MNLILTIVAIAIWGLLAVIWFRRIKERRAWERLSITPEALHDLIAAHHDILILDVRQPLDLLADSEIIEGSQRISPQDAEANPSLIPADKELVVYCTCPSDKTSRAIAAKGTGPGAEHRCLAGQVPQGRLGRMEGKRLSGGALRQNFSPGHRDLKNRPSSRKSFQRNLENRPSSRSL